jgi:two-component system, OmpR family, phosphate regulon sensor histidine kinase PhoR
MKRKISFEFVILIFCSLVVFIIGATFFAKNSISNLTKLNLEKYLEIIEIDYEAGLSETEIIEKYQGLNDYLRITFIDPSGVVLADSLATELENHLDRPEIQDIGNAYSRRSATLNVEMMYLATQLSTDHYLRIAIPLGSILQFLNDFIGLSIVIGVVIVVLSILSSSYLIKQSLKPLIEIKTILQDVNQGEYSEIMPVEKYDEINGLINEINDINKSISYNITSLKSEKQKSDFLLDHMNQGICVLDEEGRIILLNQYLKNLYRFNIDININKDYRYLFRDDDVQAAINKAYLSKTNSNMVVKIKDDFYSVSISYLEKDWNNNSSVILIYSDITAIRNIEVLKRDFFVNASHELKSPLTSIIGSADLIAQGMAKDEAMVKDLIDRIASEAKRMNNLVMDMLVLSEYENKNQASNKSKQSIKRVTEEAIKNLEVQAKDSNILIHSEVIDEELYISYEEVYQLLKNIIENAIKYGKNSGNVWVNITTIDNNLLIEIKDDGIGIPKTDQSRIFERFYRVDKARSKSTGGTGLGLSIVKHIVLNYNGSIELESEEGLGTKVSIYLPKTELKL